MNHYQMRNSNVDANATKNDLLRELGNETGTARRQELLKAIWRLHRQAAHPVSSSSIRLPVAAMETPQQQRHHARIARDRNGATKIRTNSLVTTAAPRDVDAKRPSIISDEQALTTLKQLYAMQNFSLANYLQNANPWSAAGEECLREAIRRISDEQREWADRVGLLIVERRGHVKGGSFPLRFTAFNDLSVAYLAPRVVEDQERIIGEVSKLARNLESDPVAHKLAIEVLGSEQAHLNNLRELLARPKSDTDRKSAVTGLSGRRCQDSTPIVATAA